MRLIDADKLIEDLNKRLFTIEWTPIVKAMLLSIIDEQPEAYSVEKVVEQLEDEKIRSYANITEYGEEIGKDLDDCDWFYCGLVRAIEIVRGGWCR